MRPIFRRFIIACPLALVLVVAACGMPTVTNATPGVAAMGAAPASAPGTPPPTVAPHATAVRAPPSSQKPVAPPTTSANPLSDPPVY